MRLLTCDPKTEVYGQTLLALLNNLNAGDIAPFLEQYRLSDIQPEEWYPLQDFLHLLNELNSQGQTPSFVAIGMAIAQVAPLPPGLNMPTLAEMLESWDAHYQVSHRNGDIGHKISEKVDAKHYRIVLNGSVYPDDFEYGVLYGFMKRFLPPGRSFKVWYEEGVQRLDQGGKQTVLHASWA